jgi:hypothetical protein
MTAGGCTVILASGRPCRAVRLPDETTCLFHSDRHRDAVAQGRRRGGLHRRREQGLAHEYAFRGLGDAEAILRFLEIAAYNTLALEVSATRVRLIIALCETATRLLGPGAFEERLTALEAGRGAEARPPVTDDGEDHGQPEAAT